MVLRFWVIPSKHREGCCEGITSRDSKVSLDCVCFGGNDVGTAIAEFLEMVDDDSLRPNVIFKMLRLLVLLDGSGKSRKITWNNKTCL